MARNIILLLVGLMMFVAGSCLGQDAKMPAMAGDTASMSCPMGQGMGKDMKGKDMQKMKKMGNMQDIQGCMMGCMMKPVMIATSDGGVVILMGNKLTKYDKNLTLIKEVEIKMGMPDMKKMMEEMKK